MAAAGPRVPTLLGCECPADDDWDDSSPLGGRRYPLKKHEVLRYSEDAWNRGAGADPAKVAALEKHLRTLRATAVARLAARHKFDLMDLSGRGYLTRPTIRKIKHAIGISEAEADKWWAELVQACAGTNFTHEQLPDVHLSFDDFFNGYYMESEGRRLIRRTLRQVKEFALHW